MKKKILFLILRLTYLFVCLGLLIYYLITKDISAGFAGCLLMFGYLGNEIEESQKKQKKTDELIKKLITNDEAIDNFFKTVPVVRIDNVQAQSKTSKYMN